MKNILSCLAFIFIFSIGKIEGQSDSLKADKLYAKGKELYYNGNYKDAKKIFSKALKIQEKIYGNSHLKTAKTTYRLAKINRKMGYIDEAIQLANNGLENATKIEGNNINIVGNFINELGHIYSSIDDYEKALFHFNKKLAYIKKESGEDSISIAGETMNIGMLLTDLGMFEEAREKYNEALAIYQKIAEPESKEFYRIYFNMANLYRVEGDSYKNIEYAKKALEIRLKVRGESHPGNGMYYGLIGRGYLGLDNYEEALAYMKKYVDILEKTEGKNEPNTAGAYSELATVYTAMGKHKKAIDFYEKAYKVFVKRVGKTHRSSLAVLGNIGRVYESMNDDDKALEIHKLVLETYENISSQDKSSIVGSKRRIARTYYYKNDIDKANVWIQEAIKTLVPDSGIKEGDVYANPNINDIEEQEELLRLFRYKSRYLQGKYEKDDNINDLRAAFNTSELALNMIQKMRTTYESEDSRSFLNSKHSKFYLRAVEQAFLLYQLTNEKIFLEKAFNFSEQNKASILWQNLNERYAFEAANIPEDITEKIKKSQREISLLKKKISYEKENTTLKDELFDTKLKHGLLIKELEKYNPTYYQLKYAENDIDINELKNKIPNENTAIIEYLLTNKSIFIFLVKKDGIQGYKKEIPNNLKDIIFILRQDDIKNKLYDQSFQKTYISHLNTLHELLIQPIEKEINGVENLNIIPHDILQYISFETLTPTKESHDFRKLDYLIKNHNIQYAWSAVLWAKSPAKHSKSTYDFVGFAPDFSDKTMADIVEKNDYVFRDMQVALSHSIPEIKNASTHFDGKTFTANNATEQQFLQFAPKSRIIHLATHAIANDKSPMESGLLFSSENDSIEDGFLNIPEIYSLNLSADLAIMSACNTGFGQLDKGEGILSLGRAFSYAGCKSIIMSLWLANDQSTSHIIQDFYQNSSLGFPKNTALRNAKLNYLKTADPLTAHPFFWANLIVIGDMSPLIQKSTFSYWWGLLLVVGLLSVWWFYQRKS